MASEAQERTQDFEAAHIGHFQIEENRARLFGRGQPQSLRAAGRLHDVKARIGQQSAEKIARRLIVVDNQQFVVSLGSYVRACSFSNSQARSTGFMQKSSAPSLRALC